MAVNVGTAVAYLDLNMTAFNSGLQQAQSALQTFQSQSATSAQRWMATGGMIANIGQSLTRNVSVPLVNLGTSSVQAARDFESAFAGVKKTIDESRFAEYAVTWDDLSNAIQEMANETGISAEEIAGVMEYAGQLGVELGDGGKNIIEFTRQMTMLGVATNMTAQEASLDLAKFMNVTGLMNESTEESAANVRGLGSAITALGNNFATQEGDIVQMSQRLASAGTVAGLTAQEIVALATAISSAGIKTEAGASSMSTTLTMIEKIVSGIGEGSEEKLQKIAEVSGMTAEQFSDIWRKEPIAAIQAFLVGLGNANTETESMVQILDELGMTSIRQSNLLRALGLSAENMSYAVDVANQSWQDAYASAEPAGALVEEFNKRMETLDSRLAMLNERWKQVKREIAETLIPILEKLMDVISKLIAWWNDLDDSQKKMIVTVGIIVAAIPPLISMLGSLITTIGLIKGLKMASGLATVANNAEKASSVIFKFGDIIQGSVYKNCNNASMAVGSLNGAFNLTSETANVTGQALQNYGGQVAETTSTTDVASKATSGFATTLQHCVGVLGILGGSFLYVSNMVDAWNNGLNFTNGLLGTLGIAIAAIGAILLGANPVITAIVALVIWAVSAIVLAVKEHWDDIVNFFKNGWAKIKEIAHNIGQSIKDTFNGILDSIKNVINSIMDGIKGFIKGIMDNIINPVVDVFKIVADKISGLIDKIVQKVKNSALGRLVGRVQDFFDGSHRDGLAYVPYDGYVAELHKGERVLTAQENQRYSSGVSGSGTTINFYSNERIDEYTAAKELRRTMKDIELGLV